MRWSKAESVQRGDASDELSPNATLDRHVE
jgi:hypothetical protein